MCLGLFYLFGGSLADFMAPMYIGWSIDYMSAECYSEITYMCIQFFAVCIFTAVMAGLRARLFNVMSDRIARNLKTEIFNKILICDTAFFDRKTNMTGALLSRINGDVEKI